MFHHEIHTINIMCPTQLRNKSGDCMHSERMTMPKWAKSAATVLSDKQLLFKQNEGGHAYSHPPSNPPGLSDRNLQRDSSIAKSLGGAVSTSETVGGTVSRKGKFGFTCESCSWVPAKGGLEDWVKTRTGRYLGLHFPERCKKCKSRMKRWTCAARNYDKLELLRQLEGRHCLRFVTLTREEWNVKVSPDNDCNNVSGTLWGEAEILKKKAVKQFRNWRTRNKYWQSREAKGQCYYEVTMKPVWNGWGFDEVQLHFHIHMVVCSKRIENKDIQIDLDTLEPIPMSTTIQREWGRIVDVRKCRTWKHKDGEVKTSKRFVMNYLVDYINKSPHWQSTKFGDWSN